MAKKKNPQDATLRNVRAANKHIAALETRMTGLEAVVTELRVWVNSQPKASSDVSE